MVERLLHSRVLRRSGFHRVLIAFLRGLLGELLGVVGPQTFAATPEFSNGLDAIANLSASITVHVALHGSLVPIDEQPAWREILDVLGDLSEVEGGADRIRCATAQVS